MTVYLQLIKAQYLKVGCLAMLSYCLLNGFMLFRGLSGDARRKLAQAINESHWNAYSKLLNIF